MTSSSNPTSNELSTIARLGEKTSRCVLGDRHYRFVSRRDQKPRRHQKIEESEVILHSKRQVAEYLGVSLATVNRLIGRGELRAVKLGHSVRISQQAVDELVTRNEIANEG